MNTVRTKKKKAGRRPKVIKKDVRAAVRFTKSEYFIVKEKAALAGTSISNYLRNVAINADLKNRLTEEERQFVRQLAGMSANINQVAKCFHREGTLSGIALFERYRIQLDVILKKLKV
ncbi:plasmid mobilization protein [Longitalea luteola]|uniref:plasmid mobilization protein n=1 Tax=Longitalea luteola TaxID=2812563 RepID=UPI001A968DBD|nr:plasmid mobilization relaxosome protein MobC [Longitalea luteola]